MSKWLDSVLQCPITGAPLEADGDSYVSTGNPAYRYPITNGVPLLLPDRAELVKDSDKDA